MTTSLQVSPSSGQPLSWKPCYMEPGGICVLRSTTDTAVHDGIWAEKRRDQQASPMRLNRVPPSMEQTRLLSCNHLQFCPSIKTKEGAKEVPPFGNLRVLCLAWAGTCALTQV